SNRSENMATTGTQRIADFVARLAYDDLPPEVVTKTKLHLLDTIGCALAFARYPAGTAAHDYVQRMPAPPEDAATVTNYGGRATAEVAAFANATFAHGFELDDTDLSSVTHPGAVVVPAALA